MQAIGMCSIVHRERPEASASRTRTERARAPAASIE